MSIAKTIGTSVALVFVASVALAASDTVPAEFAAQTNAEMEVCWADAETPTSGPE